MKLFNRNATVQSRRPMLETLEGRQFMSASTLSLTTTSTPDSASLQVTADKTTTTTTKTTTIGDMHVVILISKSTPKIN